MNFKNFKNTNLFFIIMFVFHWDFLQACEHLVVTGSGIACAVEILYKYYECMQKNISFRITIFEKNRSVNESPATQIAPSLTPDEMVSVVPRGPIFLEKLQILFSQPGGIRVDDVDGINGSKVAEQFMQQATFYSLDELGHAQRTQDLLTLGKMSMDLWQDLYDKADDKLQEIFRLANFNPCRQSKLSTKALHDGYRIDLIYDIENAEQRAVCMKADYEKLGYDQCTILTPAQVMQLDPSLKNFCQDHSMINTAGTVIWKNDTTALWRPGGCLDASVFIPKVYEYLQHKMGDNFKLHCCHKVIGVEFGRNEVKQSVIVGLQIADHKTFYPAADEKVSYLFCPGESVGTLHDLGFVEPAYSGFAGASLQLTIPIAQEREQYVSQFNHCMEVHQEGIVLAWQARIKDHKIFISVAGTKAFYADQLPHKDQAFAVNRNLLQLNMINNVLPEFVSWAFGYDTKGKTLTEQDLHDLELKGIARRWVGLRSVAYDGFPTLGYLYKDGIQVSNARCTTHLGSGGVSFSPAVATMSRAACDITFNQDAFMKRIIQYGDSSRTANK